MINSTLNWDKLRIFYIVAEAGTLTQAAITLNMSQSAISRQITTLESHISVALFHRHARGLVLTEKGEILFKTVRDVFGKLALAEANIKDLKDKPSGELKITTTVGLGTFWLTPRLKKFNEIYPNIKLNLILSDKELDLSMREADFAIRMWRPEQVDLIQKPFIRVHSHIFASAEYLEKYGEPKTIDDLNNHKLIAFNDNVPLLYERMNWLLTHSTSDMHPRPHILEVNIIHAILLAAESGLGIAILPDYMTHNNDKLIRILKDIIIPPFETYMVYPEELRNTKKINVIRDFLMNEQESWTF